MGSSTAAQAQWYGFDVDEHGVVTDIQFGSVPSTVRMQQLDHKDDPGKVAAELTAVEVITMLDGFYDGRSVAPLAPPTCVITKWGFEWIRRALFGDVPVEKFTVDVIKQYDLEESNPEDFILKHEYVNTHSVVDSHGEVVEEKTIKTKHTLKKGCRSKFASAIAREAYVKFGARPMTEANVLVTRRWLSKLLEDKKYKDLRAVDRALAIDRALFLSFLPSEDFKMMKLAISTRAWERRVDPQAMLGGLFGRAFLLSRCDAGENSRIE